MGLVLKQWVLALEERVAIKTKKGFMLHKMAVFADWGNQRNKMVVLPKTKERPKERKMKRTGELGRNEPLSECVHVKPRQLLASFILH